MKRTQEQQDIHNEILAKIATISFILTFIEKLTVKLQRLQENGRQHR